MSRSPTGSGGGLRTRVKTARGRKIGSTRWLERQLNDPYVRRARAEGYRSRAAYKLIELDERFGFLKGAGRIVDLGIAPPVWVSIALDGRVLASRRVGEEQVDVVKFDVGPTDLARALGDLHLQFVDAELGTPVEGVEVRFPSDMEPTWSNGALGMPWILRCDGEIVVRRLPARTALITYAAPRDLSN